MVDNLARLDETEESDRQGVFHILGMAKHDSNDLFAYKKISGIFENILGFNPRLSKQLVSKTSMLTWILNRIQSKTHEENRGYAAELLSILLQDDVDNRLELGNKDGVETMLKVLSVSILLLSCLSACLQTILTCNSNTAEETLSMQMKPSSWRTSSMRCAPH